MKSNGSQDSWGTFIGRALLVIIVAALVGGLLAVLFPSLQTPLLVAPVGIAVGFIVVNAIKRIDQ